MGLLSSSGMEVGSGRGGGGCSWQWVIRQEAGREHAATAFKGVHVSPAPNVEDPELPS